jgi:hypothetical protein
MSKCISKFISHTPVKIELVYLTVLSCYITVFKTFGFFNKYYKKYSVFSNTLHESFKDYPSRNKVGNLCPISTTEKSVISNHRIALFVAGRS